MSMNPPPLQPGQASALLAAMQKSGGQVVDAKVVALLPSGTTQVRIGQQTVNLSLPSLAPEVGATLSLSVRQVEGQLQLTLLSVTAPKGGAPAAAGGPKVPAPAAGVPSSAAATVELSPLARAAQQPMLAAAPSMSAGMASGSAPVTPQAGASNGTLPAASAASALSTAAEGGQGLPTPTSTGISPTQTGAPQAPASTIASAGVGTRPSFTAPTALPANPTMALAPGPASASGSPIAPALTPTAAGGVAPGTARAPTSFATPAAAYTVRSDGVVATRPVAALTQSLPAAGAPLTPQAALNQMTQASLPIQNSVVALTAALSAAVGQVALPEPVLKAAQQVLGQRLVLDGGKLDGTAIREAVRTSGVFQESLIATGRVSLAAADTKTALLGLRQALVSWLGARAPVEPVAHVPPPVRGHTPRARNGVQPGPLPLDPVEAGKHLLDRTEQALARLRLHQQASLPEQSVKADAQFSLDLPVVAAGQQSLLHMQIHGDPQQTEQDSPGRGWQVRFALNLSGIGEVGAQISMRGRAAGLMLWTENAEVASLLQDDVAALRAELNAVGVEVGSIVVRGTPPPAEPAKGGAGVNLDAVR